MTDVLAAFAAELQGGDAATDLGRAALLIAQGEYPDLDIDAQLARLDELAAGVRALIPRGGAAPAIAEALRLHLFQHEGFHGNRDDYYDPRNSYLNDVLDRKLGIPILLATVYIEVARRVGLAVTGVGYPAHFLVKYQHGGKEWIVDPFNAGRSYPGDVFRLRLREQGSTPEHMIEYYLAGVTRRQLLMRLLMNLLQIYTARIDYPRALRMYDFLLAINPWSLPDVRDRGTMRARAGDRAGAIADLETYLAHAGEVEDAAVVRHIIEELRFST